MISFALLLFISCQKPQAAASVSNAVNTSTVTNNSNSTTTADTLAIPAGAVNAKTYGAVGDGVHDDTQAIQSIVNAQSTVVLTSGTYIINSTINLPAGVKIYGGGGAIIQAGTNMSGTLLGYGRYFYINQANNCLIANVKLQPSAQAFNLAVWANACIYIINSTGTSIQYNNFAFSMPYSINGLEAVWVSGSQSNNTLIQNNNSTTLGIEYAESGACGTTVSGNTITNSYGDALSAHGNTSSFCTGNVVSNNTIINAGYMGIEDYGNVDGTIIQNNTITGTGKDPLQQANGMGISAVGVNTQVIGNNITDCQLYYIEVGGNHGQYIYNNVINDVAGTTYGIFLNYTAAQPANAQVNGSSILNNTIINCSAAIQVFGSFTCNATIKYNTITNPVSLGISVDCSAPQLTIDVSNNNISINSPSTQLRMCYHSYTSLPHGTTGQALTYTANTLTYATTSSGGTGNELGFVLGIDNTALTSNTVTGNNIKGGGAEVYAISSNGGTALNISLTNNNVYGALINYQGITIKSSTGNNF